MWSDPSLNMAYGNQWMNPSLYKNMNNEQVDWASLAQQWIKMKETTPVMPPGQQIRPPTCEPNLLGPNQNLGSQNTSNVSTSNKTISDHNTTTNPVRGNVEKPSAWNTWTWQQQQQWNWNWASSAAPPVKAPIVESVNPIRPPYVAPPVLTEPPPSFPLTSPNKQFPTNNYWPGPNTRMPPPIEIEQWNKPSIDDKSQDPSFIDAAKRKQLPAWIREGLEKMEREKRRKLELEQSFDEPEYPIFSNENVSDMLQNSPNHYDNETLMAEEEIEHDTSNSTQYAESKRTDVMKNEPPPLIPRKTKAQIWEDTMLSLRQILTRLLMDVTNDMMLSVVKEVLRSSLQTDIQGNQSQTSLAGKLVVYGSESESSNESDEEHHSSGYKQTSKLDSDEAIQERILKRQREFSNIEARILIELDQLENREKLVRSKFDNSVKLSGDAYDNGSQVVENIQSKGRPEVEESTLKLDKGSDKTKKEWSNDSNGKNGQKKKKSKSKSKRSSSSSVSTSSSESKKSYDSDSKFNYKKNDKVISKSSNKKNKTNSVKRKRRSRSRNRSRSYSRSKRSRSWSRQRSNSHSRHRDRRSPRNYRSRRSRSPISRYGGSRKHKNKRNSSSSSNESRSTKHRYRH